MGEHINNSQKSTSSKNCDKTICSNLDAEKTVSRPNWPKRALLTAGMPYGNKSLHFGHVGGVFVPADCFTRFLKDCIGSENVRFISGTDCFGSPIDEGYRKFKESNEFSGSINDYVEKNHNDQLNTLKKYFIDLSIFEGSGLGKSGKCHQNLSDEVLTTLKECGVLRVENSKQFYDTKAHMFLNGRQVNGRCPVQGCKSDSAYADECSLGHQYAPADLIAPRSSVTNTVPELRDVQNWYFDLPAYVEFLKNFVKDLDSDETVRKVVPQTIAEFLTPPIVFVKNDNYDDYKKLADTLPRHKYMPAEENKQSFTLEFDNIDKRDIAKQILLDNNIRFRTGKTLVPFRLTGNASWGVSAKTLDDELTIWCWPESLWAPISFTMAYDQYCQESKDKNTEKKDNTFSYKDFWCSKDACVYQFIGQDNIYFYGVAQPALFDALKSSVSLKNLCQTKLVANHHVLFGKTKASSSGDVKPPSADELLDYYTPEQLRAHWLALGLAQKSVGFSPKPFEADEKKRNDPRVADPVLKEGTLLTNVYNRLARSCFYEAKNNFDCNVVMLDPSIEVKSTVKKFLLDYENLMYKVELYSVMQLMDEFIRFANKYWAEEISKVSKEELSSGKDVRKGDAPSCKRAQILSDSIYLLYASTLMMHPIAPCGTKIIQEYMNFDYSSYFNWDNIYSGLELKNAWGILCPDSLAEGQCKHRVKEIPPRFDFFKKHESQYKKK